EGCAAGLRTLLDLASEEPLSARLVLLEAQSAGPISVRRYNDLLGEAAEALRSCRAEAKGTEGLPAGFEEALVTGVVWPWKTRLARGEDVSAEPLWGQVAKILFEPYLDRRALERLLSSAPSS